MGKQLGEALKVKTDIVEASSKTGKIEAFWVDGAGSNSFLNSRKDASLERQQEPHWAADHPDRGHDAQQQALSNPIEQPVENDESRAQANLAVSILSV